MLLRRRQQLLPSRATTHARAPLGNEERPFENDASFRFLCEKNNSSLFVLGSHSRKRPDNMILVRMFEFNVLDMCELGLTSIRSIADFRQETFAVGSKPFMLFQGDAFENHPTYQQLKSLFMHFFCTCRSRI